MGYPREAVIAFVDNAAELDTIFFWNYPKARPTTDAAQAGSRLKWFIDVREPRQLR